MISNQLLKAGTSIGANYREANERGVWRDFTYKISIARKGSVGDHVLVGDLLETGLGARQTCEEILAESGELLAIFARRWSSSMRSGERSLRNAAKVSTTAEPGYARDHFDMDINKLIPTGLMADDG